jgi:nascent polypeptide-associated complex subunit alpha
VIPFSLEMKKSRKAMQKLGMKAITGVSRVTVKKSKTVSFLITSCHSSL